MKLIILLLLFTSCATKNRRVVVKSNCEDSYLVKFEKCMVRFSNHGFDSDAVVNICSKIYERRK
jgi:hypothetical protein